MIIYVVIRRPIQSKIEYINIWVLEGIIFAANMSALALVAMHYSGNTNETVKDNLADVIIICNYLIDYIAIIFLLTKAISTVRQALVFRKEQSTKEKGVWLQLLFLPFQQGGMGFEQVRILEASEGTTTKVVPMRVKPKKVEDDSDKSSSRPLQQKADQSNNEIDSTFNGLSPSPLKEKKARPFNFTKSSILEVPGGQTEQSPVLSSQDERNMNQSHTSDLGASGILKVENNSLQRLVESRKQSKASPLIRPVRADSISLSKIELPSENKDVSSIILQDQLSPSPEEGNSPRITNLNSPENEKFINDGNKQSFLERARLRRGLKPKKKDDEDESIFTVSAGSKSSTSKKTIL